MATILDGTALAKRLNGETKQLAAGLARPPGLAVILVGDDAASQVYVRRKGEVAERIGFRGALHRLPATATQAEVEALVDRLNADPEVDGLLVQLPLPGHLDARRVLDRLDPRKDVDGLCIENAGLLSQGRPRVAPCTPGGVMRLLAEGGVSLKGARAIVLGRSNIVGRPMAQLLEQADATVTVVHSRTRDLADRVRESDVVVAAIGRPELVRGDWIRDGAAVIDVGMNRLEDGRLVGDVAFEEASARASCITPVPGGVGPMTIAMLMRNTFEAARRAANDA